MKKILLAISAIIVVAVLCVGGYFVYQKYSTSKTQNQTAGWKTYTNNQYGFQINYPADYNSDSIVPWGLTGFSPQDEKSDVNLIGFGIEGDGVNGATPATNFDEAILKMGNAGDQASVKIYKNPSVSDAKSETFEFSSTDAVTQKNVYNLTTLIQGKLNIIEIDVQGNPGGDVKNLENLSDQLLSTFKLTNPTANQVAQPTITSPNIIGFWQNCPSVAAGYCNRYHFYSNGNFEWYVNQMACLNGVLAQKGTWKINNGEILLTLIQQFSGQAPCGPDALPNKIAPPVISKSANLSVSDIFPVNANISPYEYISIADQSFYHLSNDPTFNNSEDQKIWNQANCVPEGGNYAAPLTSADLCCAGLVEQPTTQSGTVGICVKPTNQAAGWKTYTNTQYGFEIQYPVVGGVSDNGNGNFSIGLHSNSAPEPGLNIDIVKSNAFNGNCNYNFTGKTVFVKINNINFIKSDVSGVYSGNQTRDYADEYCATNNGFTYRLTSILYYSYLLSGSDIPPRSDLENDVTVNEAINSFKFTN